MIEGSCLTGVGEIASNQMMGVLDRHLMSLKQIVGNARVVALGETAPGIHEFLE